MCTCLPRFVTRDHPGLDNSSKKIIQGTLYLSYILCNSDYIVLFTFTHMSCQVKVGVVCKIDRCWFVSGGTVLNDKFVLIGQLIRHNGG